MRPSVSTGRCSGFSATGRSRNCRRCRFWVAPAGYAVNLWQARPGHAGKTVERYAPGFHHFAFNADSRETVDRCYDLLRREGIEVLDAPAVYDYLPGYYAVFFADPDGLKFELVHIPPESLEAVA
jgi:glyoxylase I family protein